MAKSKKSHPVSAGKKAPVKKRNQPDQSFSIVGIGASAGGLEALKTFFSHMPAKAGVAFVIIQHLSPHHKSAMPEILAQHTPMTVRQIEDGMRLAPDCVYLNPPDKNVAVFNGTLHLMEPLKSGAINLPIDFFFRSLSEDRMEKAIGVIVSGTASDGTLGIKAIKGEGGMAMAQDPETASYDGMPRSAIATGMVDFIVPVEKMPEALLGYIKHPFVNSQGLNKLSESNLQNQLRKIFALIRSATGHDFSHYKQTTIQRRIERRLAIHQIDDLATYVHFLQKPPPHELMALFKDLLIGVTNFFREPEAFKALAQKGLEKILQGKKAGDPLRCWVAGCSTGEEAYSLAMLVAEAQEKANQQLDVQIFASDIDETAIEFARSAIYPEAIAADVSKERLKRFFSKEQGAFRVKKKIRDNIVFSLHSLIKDPPFSRLDLVSCRNVLIYMDAALQKTVIPMLHYALNPNGILFLGSSESIGGFTDLFQPLDSKQKLFVRKEDVAGQLFGYPANRYTGPKATGPSVDIPQTPIDLPALAEKTLLEHLAPAGVLINDNYEILHFVGPTEKYLVPPTGRPSFSILSMARADLKFKLTSALHRAVRDKVPVKSQGIRVGYNGNECLVDVSILPLIDTIRPAGLLMVIFEARPCNPPDRPASDKKRANKAEDPVVRQLEQELQSTREYLQATIEEMETSTEELKSNNEEMQSVNEELQSSNEELETSKEELHSTNEELNTVNAELQNRVLELARAGDDMQNLLAATDIACIILDDSACIQRYTPAAANIVKLIPTDIGRPLNDLKTSFPNVELAQLAQKVLDDLNTLEMEIESADHIWYLLRVLPYRTTENVIQGVVMTLVDIHRLRLSEAKVRRLATVLQDSNDAVTVQDFYGQIIAWNKGAEIMYGWTESEALQMNIVDLIPEDKRKEAREFVDRIRAGETVRSFKTRRKTKSGRILDIWMTATTLTDKSGRPVEMATTERDLAWLSEGEKP